MSAGDEVLVDAAIGETRRVTLRDGRVVAIEIFRASDEGARALWSEVYAARVRKVERRLRGAFIDLGLAEDGFLTLSADGSLGQAQERFTPREGEAIVVAVTREGGGDKGPKVVWVRRPHPGLPPRRLERHDYYDFLETARPADRETRARIDATIEDALAPSAPIPGGGVLTIEATRALVAIDVDAASRAGGEDSERFAFELNLAAAKEIVRQARLRSLRGIIAVDFVTMRRRENNAEIERVMKDLIAEGPAAGNGGKIATFGVYLFSLRNQRRPLHETLCAADGRLSAESAALKALREIEREGGARGGRRIAARVAPEALAWLESAPFDWRGALDGRIGARWEIAAEAGFAREKIDVRAV